MKNKLKNKNSTRPEGAKSIAQGNALCRKTPHLNQALKGRNQEDVAPLIIHQTVKSKQIPRSLRSLGMTNHEGKEWGNVLAAKPICRHLTVLINH